MRLLGVLLLFLTCGMAAAQCVSCRQCPTTCPDCDCEPEAVGDAFGEYRWYRVASQPDQLSLYRGGVQIGAWSIPHGVYRAIEGGVWTEPRGDVPIPLPPAFKKRDTSGVDRSKLRNAEDDCFCTISGKRVGFAGLQTALEDDSAKLWLVVTGDGRERVVADLKADPKFAAFLSHVRLWNVPKGHPSLLDRVTGEPLGFADGKPGITLCAADGSILHVQHGYAGPGDLDALRKKDPNLPKNPDPKNPDPKKPDEPDVHNDEWHLPACCGLAALIVCGALYLRKDK